jgi:hypothetical protein
LINLTDALGLATLTVRLYAHGYVVKIKVSLALSGKTGRKGAKYKESNANRQKRDVTRKERNVTQEREHWRIRAIDAINRVESTTWAMEADPPSRVKEGNWKTIVAVAAPSIEKNQSVTRRTECPVR